MTSDATRRPRKRAVLALALIAPLLLTGCSSAPPDPIRIGSAPATPTGKADLSAPVDPSGFFVFNRWPNACELLTDGDIRAVFPQAQGILRKPADEKLRILPDLRAPRPVQEVTVKNASCRVAFSLPGVELKDELPDTSGYQIKVRVDAAGTAEVVRDNYAPDEKAPPVSVGGAECRIRTHDFSCLKGQVAFTLSGNPAGVYQGKFDGKLRLRYQVGPEVRVFDRSADAQQRGKEEGVTEAIWNFENEHIQPELVKAIASKI